MIKIRRQEDTAGQNPGTGKETSVMNMIETKNLTKSYGDFTAVSNLNLHVPKGCV